MCVPMETRGGNTGVLLYLSLLPLRQCFLLNPQLGWRQTLSSDPFSVLPRVGVYVCVGVHAWLSSWVLEIRLSFLCSKLCYPWSHLLVPIGKSFCSQWHLQAATGIHISMLVWSINSWWFLKTYFCWKWCPYPSHKLAALTQRYDICEATL